MGIIDRLTAPLVKERVLTTPNIVGATGAQATSGMWVSDSSALTCAAVYACVRLLADSIASLPIHIFERGGKQSAVTNHSLLPLLSRAPNLFMSAFSLRQTLQAHLGLRGNAYALIERKGRQVVALWPLRADRMTLSVGEDENGHTTLRYDYMRATGGSFQIPESDILHIRALGGDGVQGLSPVALHRQGIGLALATEEAGSRFFANSARPSGIYETPNALSPDAYQRLKESLDAQYASTANTGRSLLLEEGLSWKQVSLSNEDSQYLETRNFQVQEIARMYRIEPSLIGASSGDSMTYANVEQRALGFVQFTLLPWFVCWEQEIERKLFSPADRERYFVRHNVDALLRADLKTRYEAHAIGIRAGFLTRNEARGYEDMQPLAGLDQPLDPAATKTPPKEEARVES